MSKTPNSLQKFCKDQLVSQTQVKPVSFKISVADASQFRQIAAELLDCVVCVRSRRDEAEA